MPHLTPDELRHGQQLVARNLRAERTRAGLRQSDLAAMVGMPRSTLAELEAGRRRFYLSEAIEFCHALEIPLAAVLAGDDPSLVWARRTLGLKA